ncbi:MAG: HNH endonuclease signature motif containing protein, partial [Actinomycetota bacterium]|nr:HNH endonuclease signature motif containing protein [Actinomycetota bacterium]
TYAVPRRLFRQVAARDGGCRFPGCCRPIKYTNAHHIRWWRRDQGPTDYDNLVLLCTRHHHQVHKLNIQLKLLPGGDLHVTWPDGHERTTQPRGAPPKPPV